MTVYVDELTVYPNAKGIFKKGSCHLTADTDEELHEFAKQIGMKFSWFQKSKFGNHYDLVASRRSMAVKLGAKQETNRDGAIRRMAARDGNP